MQNTYSIIKTYLNESDDKIISHLFKLQTFDSLMNMRIFSTNNNILLDSKNYTILPIHEAKYIYDTIFVWDLLSLELAIEFPNKTHIYYLMIEQPPWIEHPYTSYLGWHNIFDNNKITIITDSEESHRLISCTWNDKTKYVEQLNLKVIYNEILQPQ